MSLPLRLIRRNLAAEIQSTSISKRFLSQSTAPIEPIDLAYDRLVPADQNTRNGPLLILHGLFGSKRNWLSLSKALVRDLGRPVYILDLRNHGSSPQLRPMTYEAMVSDVLHFCHKHSISDVSLLGHSMGGKVAMALALSPHLPPGLLSHLVIADMTPAKGGLSPEFRGYIKGMKKIEAEGVYSRKEAHDILTEFEQDPSIRDFLLTNLIPPNSSGQHATFRIPLDIIDDAIAELGSFPYEVGERTWEGKTLLMKGAKSKYVNRHNIPVMKNFFPNVRLETLDTGHWIHAEAPHEFKKSLIGFIGT